MADAAARKRPGPLAALLLLVSRLVPAHALGAVGAFSLAARRAAMQAVNLYAAPLAPEPPAAAPPPHRAPDGRATDPAHPAAGAAGSPFGRNMPPAPAPPPALPPVQRVAERLLRRDRFRPAGLQLNVLAAAWIQAMTHDWFGHFDDPDREVELADAPPGCPLAAFRFNATKPRPDGAFDNFRTHWWDASFVYGQDAAAVARARTGHRGRVHVSESPGLLARDPDGAALVGDAKNGWLGVAMLQELFAREHNAVADAIANEHPHLAPDDDKLFNLARLVVSAVAAKIHTVDWTIELLKTDQLDLGMKTNWYGLFRALGWSKSGPPGVLGLVGLPEPETHGVPFCLTEEFVSVYRMHPLLPDGLPLETLGFRPLESLVGLAGEAVLDESPKAPAEVWDALVRYPCGNMELFNYPAALRNLPPTDDLGRALPEHVDLAALDLYRDRERGIRQYNDFRKELSLKPFKTYRDMCGGNEDYAAKLEEVYGEGGVDKVDLMVGMLAEKKIPGFAISETAFLIFLLMASRRLEADRFFTSDFNEETYTKAGLAWVKTVDGMRDVLRRHFPDIERKIPEGTSAFKPRDHWPEDAVREG